MKLKLADNLSLPLDFVTERIAFLARTGAGKSGGMRVEFEQFIDAGIFSIFVDPKGDAWGIRAEGKGPGKPVLVIGGDHGDIPLEPTGGKVIAEFLMRERVSCVIDISDFSTTEMWRFMADFCKTAYKLNRDVCHLFIDEVDMVAGQQYFDPHCLHGIQLIQNKGRNRGWGVTIASQRPQMVNLTVLNASGTYIVMQTIGDDDLKVVRRLLGAVCSKEVTNEVVSQLPTLQTREAFVYSPQLLGIDPVRITFAEFQTFDSMRTPKPGETRKKPKSLADIDLSAVKEELAATIEKVKGEDPKLLQAEIRRLNAEIAKKSAVVPSEPTIEVLEVFPKDLAAKIGTFFASIVNEVHSIDKSCSQIRQWADQAVEMLIAAEKSQPKAMAAAAAVSRPHASSLPKPAPIIHKNITKNITDGDGDISPREQNVLNAIALCEVLRIGNPKRSIAAFLSGYSDNSTFRFVMGSLSGKGLISYPSPGVVSLTDDGRPVANADAAPVRTLNDLHELWLSKVSPREQSVLTVLIQLYPESISRPDLAAACGYEDNSTFRNILGALSGLGALIYPQSGWVKASETLFPEGLA